MSEYILVMVSIISLPIDWIVMEELCSKTPEDDTSLLDRIDRFLSDRSIDTVTGIRRMGRDNLVDLIKDICESSGRQCSVYPYTSSNDIIIFRYWSEMSPQIAEILERNPETDILYGQDLCHQVPAIVRYRHRTKRRKGRGFDFAVLVTESLDCARGALVDACTAVDTCCSVDNCDIADGDCGLGASIYACSACDTLRFIDCWHFNNLSTGTGFDLFNQFV